MSETDDPRSSQESSHSTPDDAASTQPTDSSGSSDVSDASPTGNTSGAIPPTIGAAVACALPIIGSIIMLVLERKNQFVRFYSFQSLAFGLVWIVLGIGLTIVNVILGFIPIIGWLLAILLSIFSMLLFVGFLILWVVQIIKALTNVEWEIPFLGPIARNLQAGKPPFENKG